MCIPTTNGVFAIFLKGNYLFQWVCALDQLYMCTLQILLLQRSNSEYCKKYSIMSLSFIISISFMLLKPDYFWMQYNQFIYFFFES